MMFIAFVVLLATLCLEKAMAVTNAWTYHTTPDTCTGSYSDPCGQENWGNVAPTCATGKKQTPIDISNVIIRSNLSQPALNAVGGGCQTWTQFSNNYTFEVAFIEEGYTCSNLQLSYNGKTYTMQQIHFHTPSEHVLGGGYFSGEAHMVHKSNTGDLLVLGVFLQVAANNLHESNNTFFQGLWEIGEDKTFLGEEVHVVPSQGLTINPYKGLLPGRFSNYRYKGSLTTPPCTEGVQWFVFDQPIQISQYDFNALRKAASAKKTTTVSEYGNTNRYTQPLNNRTVLYSTGAAPSDSASNIDSTATTTIYVSDDDATDRRIRRLSIAAIVLAAFSTILALALAVWVSIIQSKV